MIGPKTECAHDGCDRAVYRLAGRGRQPKYCADHSNRRGKRAAHFMGNVLKTPVKHYKRSPQPACCAGGTCFEHRLKLRHAREARKGYLAEHGNRRIIGGIIFIELNPDYMKPAVREWEHAHCREGGMTDEEYEYFTGPMNVSQLVTLDEYKLLKRQ